MSISKTSRTTIIITTHYIEEARKADRVNQQQKTKNQKRELVDFQVGLMRTGRMLAEDEPSNLLSIHQKSVRFEFENN